MKPSREELLKLVKKTIVPHTAFQRGSEILAEAWAMHQPGDVSGVPVLAESRCGKTSLLAPYRQKYPKDRTKEGLEVPVLSVRMPTGPTISGLCEKILTALEDPEADKGTQSGLETRASELSKKCGVRMLILEEYHQVFNPTRGHHMYSFGEFLKNYAEESGAMLVPIGLPHAEFALKRNEQLLGRMRAPIRLPRFDWTNQDSREEFVAILEAMHASIGRYFKIPKLEAERIAFLFFCATGGIIGYIAKILDQAVCSAVLRESSTITLEDLAVAHGKCLDPGDFVIRGCSPFDETRFKPKVDDVLMGRIRRIGVRPEDAPNATAGKRRKVEHTLLVSA